MTTLKHELRDEFLEKSNYLKNRKEEKVKNSKEFILWAETKIEEMHQWLKNHDFENEKEEIEFFKEIKPFVLSKLIFHKERLRIITNSPIGKSLSVKFYEKELLKISQNQNADLKFYNYYKGLSTEFDNLYFTRKTKKSLVETDCCLIGCDKRIWTCYDYKMAEILASEELIIYIENKIKKLKYKSPKTVKSVLNFQSQLIWTGTKIELTEMAYAFKIAKVINNGNADIKDIARVLSKSFNIDITDNLYRTYQDIKNRKNPDSNFTTSLSNNFQKKMMEENY